MLVGDRTFQYAVENKNDFKITIALVRQAITLGVVGDVKVWFKFGQFVLGKFLQDAILGKLYADNIFLRMICY